MRKLRISAISFLNTAPLMWDFEHPPRAAELAKEFEISYTLPSLCAEALRTGEADIGIIPAITYQSIPDLAVIPNIAIAARGPVRSILLVSKVPIAEIQSVAVDTSSRTSVALLEILFRNGWLSDCHSERSEESASARNSKPETGNSDFTNYKSQITNQSSIVNRQSAILDCHSERSEESLWIPKFVPAQPNLAKMLRAHDAALLIGDPALTVERSRYHVVDLAEAWRRATGLPFVFAFWAVRKSALAEFADPARLCVIFRQSRDHGLEHSNEIANAWAPRVGISKTKVTEYLTQNIHYSFDSSEQTGLTQFFELAFSFQLVPQLQRLQMAADSLVASSPS